MPTIDLTTPPAAAPGTLEALPRRVALTLPELRLLAERAGNAPLPFDVAQPAGGSALESRLGQTRVAADDWAYLSALATLHDPAESLSRRGLLTVDAPDQGVAGALGLLAAPAVALDLDVVLDQVRGRAWHRQRDDAVATLATTDGLVFELAWFSSEHWPGEQADPGARLPRVLTHRMSWTNSPSWVRLRHSTIGTSSAYSRAAESPVDQCRVCSGFSHQALRVRSTISRRTSVDRSL